MFQKQVAFSLLCTFILTLILTTTTSNAQIQAGEKDTSKYYTVTSEDGIDVPVPYGFCPSNQEDERYVNGKIENKRGNIVATLPTENLTNWAYEDVTINNVTQKYWYNTTTDYCEIETPVFTIGEEGGAIDVEWSASCEKVDLNSMFQARIELDEMEPTGLNVTKTDVIDAISGSKLGITINNVSFEFLKKELIEGRYRIRIVYDGGSKGTVLDKAYVKKFKVIEYNDSGETIIENIKTKTGGFVIYETTFENLELNDYTQNTRSYNQFVWVPVPSTHYDLLYAVESDKYKMQNLIFPSTGNTPTDSIGTGPMVALWKDYDRQKTTFKKYLKSETRNNFLNDGLQELKETVESIITYGGFFIARYEGRKNENNQLVSKKGYLWFNMNWFQAYRKCELFNDGNTSLIWNNQWNYTLRWLTETSEKSNHQINNSLNWGNFLDSQFYYFSFTDNRTLENLRGEVRNLYTGVSEYTKANNVWDLGRNVWEWVAFSQTSSYSRIYRSYSANGASDNGGASLAYSGTPLYNFQVPRLVYML